jgi:hypothetical protein
MLQTARKDGVAVQQRFSPHRTSWVAAPMIPFRFVPLRIARRILTRRHYRRSCITCLDGDQDSGPLNHIPLRPGWHRNPVLWSWVSEVLHRRVVVPNMLSLSTHCCMSGIFIYLKNTYDGHTAKVDLTK